MNTITFVMDGKRYTIPSFCKIGCENYREALTDAFLGNYNIIAEEIEKCEKKR